MGTFRLLLAVSVVFYHSYGYFMVGGVLAVQLFYIISGYLISYVLIECGRYTNIYLFYANRLLRLLPIYWIVCSMTLAIVSLALILFGQTHPITTTYFSVDAVGKIALVLTNLLLIGQDWILFTGFNDGTLHLTTNFRQSEVQVWQGLLVPQAWSLGVELSFYLIAPFILKKRSTILLLFCGSLFLRVVLIYSGIGMQDPWTYRFFPCELALFLAGAGSHQYLSKIYKDFALLNKNFNTVITFLVVCVCCCFHMFPIAQISNFLLFGIVLLSLPFMFAFQNENSWDKKLGELSYPVYITHMLVIWVLDFVTTKVGYEIFSFTGACSIVFISVLFSFCLNVSVNSNIENYRKKIRAA